MARVRSASAIIPSAKLASLEREREKVCEREAQTVSDLGRIRSSFCHSNRTYITSPLNSAQAISSRVGSLFLLEIREDIILRPLTRAGGAVAIAQCGAWAGEVAAAHGLHAAIEAVHGVHCLAAPFGAVIASASRTLGTNTFCSTRTGGSRLLS